MDIRVAPCASIEELKDALGAIMHYFGVPFVPEDLERWTRLLGPGRMHAAWDGDRIVGGAGAYAHELTVPGGTVPAAGVTVVGVLPTHRRRGILRAMMRAQLDAVRERGEPVAWLWASEETIYGRFGYGMASLCGELNLPKPATAFARPLQRRGELRLVGEEEAYAPFAQIYDAVRRSQPGMLARSEDWFRLRRLADPEHRRHGAGPLHRVLLRIDGEPAGYALYRIVPGEGGPGNSTLRVIEALGATPQAVAEIWRFLLDIDWTARIEAEFLPADHPLFFLLARPRLMRFRVWDAVWVRILDVPRALAARTIGTEDRVVLEIRDPFCPCNEGRYAVGGGEPAARTTAPPDLGMEIDALGSVYLGGFTFAELARGGRVVELTERGAARADALFPRERAPWCPEIF